MAALPLKVSRNEQCHVICLWWVRGRGANASQSEMHPVTSVFRDQQCMLGVKSSLLIVHKVFIFIQQSVVDEE